MATKIPIVFAWLAYRPDSDLFRESVRSVIRTFGKDERFAPQYVMLDDAWCPVRRDVREWFLAQPDTRRIATTYRRSAMLLGGENFLGQCRAFLDAAESCELPDEGIFVKVDCDAVHFRGDWLAEFAADEWAQVAGVFDYGNDNHFSVFGFTYAVKARWLDPLARDAEMYPAHHKAWEDHETSSRIFRMCGGDTDTMLRFREGAESGLICRPLDQVNDTWVKAQCCTFAWDYQPAADKPAYRAKVAEWMKRLNDVAEGLRDMETPKTAE